jgi:hypothetical protein
LRQHAHNPVDWYAWKPEAFERARAEQKPILVSIGYSTCHWCHVMERESFENDDIAQIMNEHFINIKVDREERPDVDAIYMEACQLLTNGGGWPLNCFLTPEGKPFYAGTYFPPRPAYNRPSWVQLLTHLSKIWREERPKALEQAERLMQHIARNDGIFIQQIEAAEAAGPGWSPALLDGIFERLRDYFDPSEGGFGGAPKFPATMAIHYLLHYFYHTGRPEALEHALLSLNKMIQGGIYDQLGGGFARYATDRAWLVPHFEKMLYDNALLVTVLADACKLLRSRPVPLPFGQLDYDATATLYAETIEETLAYVQREMTHPEGGFYAAQDADSEGVEGKFYVWALAEVEALLGDEAELFCAFYGVSEAGNWEERNILWRPSSYEDFAAANGMPVDALKARLRRCRAILFEQRAQRVWPGLDDKVLLGWNALMNSAFAAAYAATGDTAYRDTALRNLDFLLEKFAAPAAAESASDAAAPLLHTWKEGQAQYDAFLEDYAFLIAALTDAYEMVFDPRYLRLAEKYTELVFGYFHDPESDLFFFTGSAQSDIVLRKKDVQDNATPSGNSTMAHNLQRLGILLDRPEWRAQAEKMLLRMRSAVEKYPRSFERWALALMAAAHPRAEIAVVGPGALDKAARLQRQFLPAKVLAATERPNGEMPLLAEKSGTESEALIYVCRDFTCQRPVRSVEELQEMLRARAAD